MKKSLCFLLLASLLAAPTVWAQSAANSGSLLFGTEAQAQQHCPADKVVWVDNRTNAYYLKGQSWYGNTKRGSYVCEPDAKNMGDHAAKNGQ